MSKKIYHEALNADVKNKYFKARKEKEKPTSLEGNSGEDCEKVQVARVCRECPRVLKKAS